MLELRSWVGGAAVVSALMVGAACSEADPATETTSSAGVGGSGAGPGGGPSVGGQGAAGGDTTSATGGGGAGAGGSDTRPVEVVILGSSSACGKNLDEPMYGGEVGGLAFAWTALYADELAATRPGSMVTNLCKSGYSTYQAMPTGTVNPNGTPAVDDTRNITAAVTLAPDVIIVAFPAVGEASNVGEIMSNFLTIESTAEAAGIPIWVSTPQPGAMMTAGDVANKLSLRDMLLTHFDARGLDFWGALVGPNDMYDPAKTLTDGGHPNKVGHAALFDVVVAAGIPEAVLAP